MSHATASHTGEEVGARRAAGIFQAPRTRREVGFSEAQTATKNMTESKVTWQKTWPKEGHRQKQGHRMP
jgi:hypothetical protein